MIEHGGMAMSMHPRMTKAGWKRLVKVIQEHEDTAADGNTWGAEVDAATIADVVIAGLRQRAPATPSKFMQLPLLPEDEEDDDDAPTP